MQLLEFKYTWFLIETKIISSRSKPSVLDEIFAVHADSSEIFTYPPKSLEESLQDQKDLKWVFFYWNRGIPLRYEGFWQLW